jgi:endonuclease-8
MEGPSIVIATEEFAAFYNKKILKAQGTAAFEWPSFEDQKLVQAASWGKHLILTFSHLTMRIHFLMFGSYRIDNPRENRIPKMQLSYQDHEIYFYSCAIKKIEANFEDSYDFTVDIMSPLWDSVKARNKIMKKPNAFICDVLMDQEIFAGVGNIIKNEVLYRLKIHPEKKISEMSASEILKLVQETRVYCMQFYEWKVSNVLKRNWKIFRKKTCPECGLPVTKVATGKLERISHFCENCQSLKS